MDTFDLFTPESQADPYPVYAQLRAHAPVYQEKQMGTWALTRYADVYAALRDHQTYSSAQGITPDSGGGMTGGFPLIMEDPPQHTKIRRIVNTAFTPSRVRQLTPNIETIADDLLAAITDDEVDIVEALTVPLPVIVISRVLGIPEHDRERFKRWSDAVTGVLDAGPDSVSVEDMAAERQMVVGEMIASFNQTIAERRQNPGDDIISVLAQTEIDGERMDDMKLLGFCILLLIAGNETTTNLIGNLLNVLVDRPDLWSALRADRTLVESAVEETLRYDSPVQMLWRTTTRPVELHGVTIPEGEKVMIGFASANRDPEEFPDPDDFKLDRDWAAAVEFGGHGIEPGLGAGLEVSVLRQVVPRQPVGVLVGAALPGAAGSRM